MRVETINVNLETLKVGMAVRYYVERGNPVVSRVKAIEPTGCNKLYIQCTNGAKLLRSVGGELEVIHEC